jgi:hypothetical protein
MSKDSSRYDTHEVTNQPPALEDYNAFTTDLPLQEGVEREGGEWALEELENFGRKTGSRALIELGFLANENPPILKTHDRFGRRIDQVKYHPAWHQLMAFGIQEGIHALPWKSQRAGTHVVREMGTADYQHELRPLLCPGARKTGLSDGDGHDRKAGRVGSSRQRHHRPASGGRRPRASLPADGA